MVGFVHMVVPYQTGKWTCDADELVAENRRMVNGEVAKTR